MYLVTCIQAYNICENFIQLNANICNYLLIKTRYFQQKINNHLQVNLAHQPLSHYASWIIRQLKDNIENISFIFTFIYNHRAV